MKKFDQKRQAIKEAGIQSFITYGYQKTTLEDIARVLGMKKNSLYYYFENKEALFFEIMRDKLDEHLELTNKIEEQDLPADQKIIEIIRKMGKFIARQTAEYSVTIEAFLDMHRVILEKFPDFKDCQMHSFRDILEEGVSGGIFCAHDTEQMARDLVLLIPAISIYNYLTCREQLTSSLNFEAILDSQIRIVQYVLDGILLNPEKRS